MKYSWILKWTMGSVISYKSKKTHIHSIYVYINEGFTARARSSDREKKRKKRCYSYRLRWFDHLVDDGGGSRRRRIVRTEKKGRKKKKRNESYNLSLISSSTKKTGTATDNLVKKERTRKSKHIRPVSRWLLRRKKGLWRE